MKIYLLDINKRMSSQFELAFVDFVSNMFEVEVVNEQFDRFMDNHSDIDAVVSPANAYGLMDGGYDAAITEYFGRNLQERVKQKIALDYYGEQPVGTSITVPISERIVEDGNDKKYAVLIHTPTMRYPSSIVDETIIYQCMRTTLIEAIKNKCNSIVIPAFGGATGGVPFKVIAEMMKEACVQISEYRDEIPTWGDAYDRRAKLTKVIRGNK